MLACDGHMLYGNGRHGMVLVPIINPAPTFSFEKRALWPWKQTHTSLPQNKKGIVAE